MAHLNQQPALTLFSSMAKPILTQSGELVVHLAGRPGDAGFVQSLQSLEREMDLVIAHLFHDLYLSFSLPFPSPLPNFLTFFPISHSHNQQQDNEMQ